MDLTVADAELTHPSHRLGSAIDAYALVEMLADGYALLGDVRRIRQRIAAPKGSTLAEDPRVLVIASPTKTKYFSE